MENKTGARVVWTIAGCIGVAFCCVIGLVLAFGGLAWIGTQQPENVDIRLDVPNVVQVGDEFIFKIEIVNLGVEPQNLMRVDIQSTYLEGIELIDSRPIYIFRDHLELFGLAFETFQFQEMALEGETLEIEFNARAVRAGDYGGEVNICVNSMVVCAREVTRTIVESGE